MQRIVSRLVLYPPLSVSMIESGVAILLHLRAEHKILAAEAVLSVVVVKARLIHEMREYGWHADALMIA